MRALVVAASSKSPDAEREIELGRRYRIDYIELANRKSFDYVDYDTRGATTTPIRRMEEKLRLDFSWSRQLARRILNGKYDLVFSLSERVGIPLSHMINKRVKNLLMMHHPMSRRLIPILRISRTLNRCDKILVFSQAEADALAQKIGLPREKVQVLHFPIDTQYHHPISNRQINEGEDFIFSIGLSNRDYPTLLEALRRLPHIQCQLCGTSAWVSHKAGYEDEEIPANVTIAHYDHPEIIRQVYAKSRFVVIPIRKETTQWSAGAASVLQPQAMGKPVIATRTPGLVDYVKDKETGILVEGGSPDAIAEAIEFLWENPHEVTKMGQRGSEWVQQHFSLDRWLIKVEKLMEEVVFEGS